MAEVVPISPFMPRAEALRGAAAPAAGAQQPFDAILNRAMESLNNVSQVEAEANVMIDDYVAGRADLSDVMVATSKMGIAVQLAVTTITTTVNSFKEITQMQV